MARNNIPYKNRMYEIRIKMHEIKKKRKLKIVKTETVEEFLARGGTITNVTGVKKPYESVKNRFINNTMLKDSYEYLTSDSYNPLEYL